MVDVLFQAWIPFAEDFVSLISNGMDRHIALIALDFSNHGESDNNLDCPLPVPPKVAVSLSTASTQSPYVLPSFMTPDTPRTPEEVGLCFEQVRTCSVNNSYI